MEQKFVSFDDALEKLGISSDRLNQLREHGQLRAYRDGSSWKFRVDEIKGMVTGGIPDLPPPSDIGLVDPADLVEAAPLQIGQEDELGLELELGEEESTPSNEEPAPEAPAEESGLDLELDDTDPISTESELELDGLEDTVPTDASDLDLVLDSPEEQAGASDSILLSEEELGESVSGSPSTIIGKKELESEEADLQLASDGEMAGQSDVSLAPSSEASDVLSSGIAGSGVLNELTEDASGMSAFEDLEELEIDLSTESSRILSPEDVAKAKEVAAGLGSSKPDSDLSLDDDLERTDEDSELGSTDVPLEKLGIAEGEVDDGSGSELELDGVDDIATSDSDGSDITLDSGDSGINLISPSDSGLALDDIPLEMGGSAILSSLTLEGSDPEISLIGGESEVSQDSQAELQTDDDFQLTPLSEGAQQDNGDSSSQVIPLDADIADLAESEVGGLDDAAFTEEAGDEVVLSEDFAEHPADELGMGYVPVGGAAGAEAPYTTWNIVGLGFTALLLMISGTMMLDMVRNIWSWGETYSLNSSLMDALLQWF